MKGYIMAIVGDRAQRNHILAYIEKEYPKTKYKEISASCFKIVTDTTIVSVLADDKGKVYTKFRKRRGTGQGPTQKTVDKDKAVKKEKPSGCSISNTTELKKHISCDFLPEEKVKVKGSDDDVYTITSLTLTESGLEYVITKNRIDRFTVVNGDLYHV
jgi:hypothetical protein